MKMGIRKPSVKKSIKARTTGKVKRQVKKAVNPMYGKKGMGMVNDPKKAVYNKVYNKTTVGVSELTKTSKSKSSSVNLDDVPQEWLDKIAVYEEQENNTSPATWKVCGIIMKILAFSTAILFGLPGLFAGMFPLLIIAIIATFGFWKLGSSWSKKAIEAKERQIMEEVIEKKSTEHDSPC